MAGERLGRRHPRPSPGLGDLRDDDLRVRRRRPPTGSPWREIVTVFFAIGMGLALDEFALWVELKDVYWEKEGRKSVDAMIIAGCARRRPARRLQRLGRRSPTRSSDAVFAGVGAFGAGRNRRSRWSTLPRRSSGWALGSLLIFWPSGSSAAVRLAKPHSFWARRFYRDGRLQALRGALRGGRRRRGARVRRLGRAADPRPLPDRRRAAARSRRRSRPARPRPGSPAAPRGCRRAGRRRAPTITATPGGCWTAFL